MANSFKLKFQISIAVITVLLIASQLLIQININNFENDSFLINIAGRQRMLSQKISKLLYLNELKERKHQEELQSNMELLIKNHKNLIKRENHKFSGKNSDKIKDLFTELDSIVLKLESEINCSIQNCKTTIDLDKYAKIDFNFLEIMDSIVFQYDFETKEKVNTLKVIQWVLLFCLLLIFIIEYKMVLIPTVADLKDSYKKIREQQQNLERITEIAEIGTISSTVIHDVKNIIAVINLSNHQIAKQLKKPPAERLENKLQKSSQFLTDHIKKLISITEAMGVVNSKDNESLQFENFHLNGAISEVLTLCGEMLNKNDVKFINEIPSTQYLEFNKNQFVQILLNLFINSVHAIQNQDNKWIRLQVHHDPDNIYLRVIDSGHGINTDEIEKIFNPYYTTKKAGKGSGLGLWSVKRLLEKNQANIKYEEYNGHTSFVIALPIHIEKENKVA